MADGRKAAPIEALRTAIENREEASTILRLALRVTALLPDRWLAAMMTDNFTDAVEAWVDARGIPGTEYMMAAQLHHLADEFAVEFKRHGIADE